MKKVLSVFLAITAIIIFCAPMATADGGFWYDDICYDGGYGFLGMDGAFVMFVDYGVKKTHITIPQTVSTYDEDGVPVYEITENAFEGQTNMKSIILPIGMTYIGENAFGECTSLEKVYYEGNAEQWDWIIIDEGNEPLLNAEKVFNYREHLTNVPQLVEKDGFLFWNKNNEYCILCKLLNEKVLFDDDMVIPEKVNFGNLSLNVEIIVDSTVLFEKNDNRFDLSNVKRVTIPSTIKKIYETNMTFFDKEDFSGLEKIYYEGSEDEWKNIQLIKWNKYSNFEEDPIDGVEIIFNDDTAKPGDVNGDNSTDNKDVVVLFRYVSGSSEYNALYDFNGDNEVNNKDVVALFREVSAK
ncbi:MAG: leucine-rich repeat protein [Clostridia bacterium]|nr:leucine-rich repeat protein [Clostridia bacterium]